MRRYFSEFIGTMVLVFMGCGAAITLGADTAGGHLAVAFAFGLSIVAMAYVIGGVSGCHINPAVSLAMLLRKKIKPADFCGYVVAQIAGAILGAAILFLLVRVFGVADLTGGLGTNNVAGVGFVGGLIVEVTLTFIFIFAILGVTSDESKAGVAGIVIGLTLVLVHIIGIPLTGTSVNPARSIGPAIFAGGVALTDLWVFIVGPLLGSVKAVVAFNLINKKAKK